jgi:hypothetical protein
MPPPPAPAPGNTCTGSSTQLPALQCAAWIKFYDGTTGDGWTHCQGTRTNPCACLGSDGKSPACNPTNTTVTAMCVCIPHRPRPPLAPRRTRPICCPLSAPLPPHYFVC